MAADNQRRHSSAKCVRPEQYCHGRKNNLSLLNVDAG
jgi:hypothetical protein